MSDKKKEVYQQVKEANPGKKMTEITKIISEQYKKLDQSQIEEYEKKYQANKVVFEKAKKQSMAQQQLPRDYEAEHGKIKNERKKKKAKATEGEAKPKKQPAVKAEKPKKASAKKVESEEDDDDNDSEDKDAEEEDDDEE